MTSLAISIVARACNDHRAANLWADDPLILRAFDKALGEKDAEIARLNAKLRDVEELCARFKAALSISKPIGIGTD